MSLRARLLLAVGLTLVCLVLGTYLVASRLMLQSFARIGHDDAAEDLTRAKHAFSQQADAVHTMTGDWSSWDDTYQFMVDHNAKYAKSNLVPGALTTLKLDIIMFVDTRGKVFQANPIRRGDSAKLPQPNEVLAALEADRLEKQPDPTHVGFRGLIMLPDGPMIVAVRPILTSADKGPSRGWVVFGRKFGLAEMAAFRTLTQMDLQIQSLDDPAMKSDRRLASYSQQALKGDFVAPVDGHTIAGHSVLKDIWNRPILLLTIQKPRTIYLQGLRTINNVRSLIVIAGLIFSAVILFVLERFAFSRLFLLTAEVSEIGEDSESRSVSVSGHDELSLLAMKINKMLVQLQAGKQQLRAQNENLEFTVAERTREITHQALHDKLTGLPNRALIVNRLEVALAKVDRTNLGIAIIYLDLDNFKLVNDSLGHSGGDDLLLIVAKRLTAAVRPGDTVARSSGDEFTVLLEDLADVDEAQFIANRIVETLQQPFQLGQREFFESDSIGVAFTTESSRSPEALMKCAEMAMYRAKMHGKAKYIVYEDSMTDEAIDRLELETDLRRAVGSGEIYLEYQPLIDLATGHIEGAEALARWNHPQHGLISPDQFIPIAEETGMIVAIGYWILETACRQTAEWQVKFKLKNFSISVNISGKQLQKDGVVERVGEILGMSGLAHGTLKLEITESVLKANRDDAIEKLRQLRNIGVKLVLDDFGTGYSSLSRVRAFPIDTLKIDQSFTARLGDGSDAIAVVEAIMALSRSMKMTVTGEGIETESQLAILQRVGCHTGQGYLLDKPLDVQAFSEQLSEGGKGSVSSRWQSLDRAA
jgi:diguanylate cyclase (GGDEF)-like protein